MKEKLKTYHFLQNLNKKHKKMLIDVLKKIFKLFLKPNLNTCRGNVVLTKTVRLVTRGRSW